MLVLGRYIDQCVVIVVAGEVICTIKVAELRKQSSGSTAVKLAFEAPPSIAIHRLEVWERILAGEVLAEAIESADAEISTLHPNPI